MGKKKRDSGEPTRAETTRIWATKFLEDFRASPDEVYTFESHLSNQERGAIHQMCQKMGLYSKSSGVGDQRRISIYKHKIPKGKSKNSKKKEDNKPKISFSPEAKAILQELFMHHPPCEEDAEETSFEKYIEKSGRGCSWKDDFFSKPQMNREELAKKVASLATRVEKDTRLQQIAEKRSKLPIASFRDAITSAVESNQIVLISGETGCGKTTQVPQYLLDHMWSKGEACKIICTQPRRISAISVSERISCERGESIGHDIGFKVRLQTRGGRHSSVVFCTNGILLRVLVGQGSGSCVSNITHIIVDEIHERDCFSDFMLAILRDMLPTKPHLRLILMSATLDAGRFSEYFGGCPVIRVPGFTYPVRTFYLEDVLSILKSGETNHLDSVNLNTLEDKHDITDADKIALDEAMDLAWLNDEYDALLDLVSPAGTSKIYNYQHSSTWLTPLMVFAGKGRVSDVCMLLSFGADWSLKSKDGLTALKLAERENQLEAAQIIREYAQNSKSQQGEQLLDNYMATANPEQVDVGLITRLLRKICGDSEDGAILVFLPGWDDINKMREKLLDKPFFAARNKFSIICLHSLIPAEEQRKVFERPPPGCRKIVLATNIAESAITIDDVVYVVDSGRMKEKSYDPYNNVSTLQSSWVSKANAKQREGRAGRCQPGICYHLYSSVRASSLPEFSVPEIRRMPIEEVCLQVKMLDPNCKIHHFLQKLMDPPVSESIGNALTVLQDIGAFTPEEELTEFGERIGRLPIHPVICKMLFFAVLVNCLDPALTLACASDYKDPFTLPMCPTLKKKADDAKVEFASLYGGDSDHLAVVAAYEGWKEAKQSHQEAKFCSEHFVSMNAMRMLDGMRKQLKSELVRHGLIPQDVSSCSLNSHDPGILRAVLVVGLYPMVGKWLPPSANSKKPVVETASGAKVRLSSRSIAFKTLSDKGDGCTLLVYDEITRGDWGMHIRNSTAVCPLPLVLFSTEIAVAPAETLGNGDHGEVVEGGGNMVEEDGMDIDKGGSNHGEKIMSSPDNFVTMVVDRWLSFKTTALEAAQIYILRQRVSASILLKVRQPQEDLPPHLGASMYAISCLLSYDGIRQSVGPLTSMADETVNGCTRKGRGKKQKGKR
ncbi:PREDICTED: DExH-box ATP-dependent RNA helicase DExH6 [Tarenaya hassleriana]|uniref:DExH-box ATP-dependent RNA helicase DExH6 n=1 Tax=Tarenaya hassleriana TaxID=28532 RepID=UPI00053C2934|nr:PREDICTED: DExH-box ATP-dependent RNA helicase DExH6 [Tarenaya hassleriana]